MKSRGQRVGIIDFLHRFDSYTLGLQRGFVSTLGVAVAPVQGPGVRMDPEEPAMSVF
jgi:hypothetical protein